MKIQFEYKCRRCGGIEDSTNIGTDELASEGSYHLQTVIINGPNRRLDEAVIHSCPDGGRGIADLIGHTPPTP